MSEVVPVPDGSRMVDLVIPCVKWFATQNVMFILT